MSRNLGETSCVICGADSEAIVLDEEPRPITQADAGRYFERYYKGQLIVAAAHCARCDAKYLAWIGATPNASADLKHWRRGPDQRFVDLSFRSSFNDEPGPDDLPTPETLRAIHRRDCYAEAKRLSDEAAAKLHEAQEALRRGEKRPRWEAYRSPS
jgi:hypothetical protein